MNIVAQRCIILTEVESAATDSQKKGFSIMKQDYINAIKEQLEACNDVALLDLVYQIMNKANERASAWQRFGKT